MAEVNQRPSRPAHGSSPGAEGRSSVTSRFERFEKRQSELWRLTFVVLFFLVLGLCRDELGCHPFMAHRYEALPIGIGCPRCPFRHLPLEKTSEISELRGLMHGLEQRDAEPPSDKQLDQLFEIIARSQQGYRDLIDSFDDVLLALSLDGQIRAVNRSFSDLVDHALPADYRQVPDRVHPGREWRWNGAREARHAAFYGASPLEGVVQVRLKSQSSVVLLRLRRPCH